MTRDIAAEMSELVRRGYKQTSRKNRTIAIIPEGMTAMEALATVEPDYTDRLRERMEREAADRFRRFHAQNHGLERKLDQEEFDVFRGVGGESSY